MKLSELKVGDYFKVADSDFVRRKVEVGPNPSSRHFWSCEGNVYNYSSDCDVILCTEGGEEIVTPVRVDTLKVGDKFKHCGFTHTKVAVPLYESGPFTYGLSSDHLTVIGFYNCALVEKV